MSLFSLSVNNYSVCNIDTKSNDYFLIFRRRKGGVSLCSILKFVTGTEEEPVLGFHIHPSIAFVKNASLVPTSNTCINKLNLSIPYGNMEVPSEDILFNLNDYAFCNAYFGL